MLSEIIHIMEYTLYIYLSVSVGYIVLFSAASHFFKQKKYPATTVRQRFIILVPAYTIATGVSPTIIKARYGSMEYKKKNAPSN